MCKYPWQDIDTNGENAITKLLRLITKGKKVLEVGCASGYVSKFLSDQLNCTVVGVEIDPVAAKEAEKYCQKVIVGDIEKNDFFIHIGAERFDIITFGDVLEHLRNPISVLKAMRPLLSDDGFILASIPNIAHISVALELLEGKFEYRTLGLLDDTHIRFFTKKSILAMFRDAGFEIVQWDRVIIKPENTEFKTNLFSYPQSLLTFLQDGSEALTYQFIIKAIPCCSNGIREEPSGQIEMSALQELRAYIVEISSRLADKERQLIDKENQIQAIYNARSWKITSPLRKLSFLLKKLQNKKRDE